MTRAKSFKLHIDSVVAINVEGLDFSVKLLSTLGGLSLH